MLDLDVKGQNGGLRSLKKNLLPSPDDAEIPKNLVQKLRLRAGQYIVAKAQMKGLKGTVVSVETVDGSRSRSPRACRTSTISPPSTRSIASSSRTGTRSSSPACSI